MATKPTDTTEGIELPNITSRFWRRHDGDWLIEVRKELMEPGPWEVHAWNAKTGHQVELSMLPRGGWLPATPAPAKDDTLGHLRQHFRSPAPEELPRVDGRFPYIAEIAGQFFIRSKVYVEEWAYVCLSSGGKWQSPYCQEKAWPTREAAAAFLDQHADQPAAVSPDATARTFENWRNDEADDATAAPVEQGDESERIKIMAAGCAEALRIQQEIVARLRGKLPKPIVGSLETYLPPGFYVIATEDAGLFDHQIVSCTDIDSGAMTIGFTYYRIDDIIEAAEAELASLKRQVEAAEKKLSAAGVCAECGFIGGHSCYCEKGGY